MFSMTNRVSVTYAERFAANLGVWVGVLLVAVLVAGLQTAQAASIAWNSPVTVDDDLDIQNGGNVHVAADFNTAEGFGAGDGVINGISFMQVDSAGIAGRLSHTFASGPNNGAAAYAATAPVGMDLDLVELLDSHSWNPGDPATATVTLEGLTIGRAYQIQVLGAVDLRTCCSMRAYEPDDGAGNFDTGVSVQRGLVQSVIGTFTADAGTQAFLWRSLGDATGNNDAAMSGLVVLRIPEPSSIMLAAWGLGLYVGAVIRRRFAE